MVPVKWWEPVLRAMPIHPMAQDLGAALLSVGFILICLTMVTLALRQFVICLHLLGGAISDWVCGEAAPHYVGYRASAGRK